MHQTFQSMRFFTIISIDEDGADVSQQASGNRPLPQLRLGDKVTSVLRIERKNISP